MPTKAIVERSAKRRAKTATPEQHKTLGGDLFRDPNAPIFGGRRDPNLKAKIDELPFVRRRTRGKNADPGSSWSVTASGDFQADYKQGRAWARLFTPLLKFNVGPVLLSWIVGDMIAAGDQKNGLVFGFVREIGDQLAHGQQLARMIKALDGRRRRTPRRASKGTGPHTRISAAPSR